MNAQADTTTRPYDAYPLDFGSLMKLFIFGAITGAIGWLLYLAIAQYFIAPVFCSNSNTFSVCRSGGTIAWFSSHVIVLAAAVAVLARFAVYRPLLVVIGALIALWGAHSWLGGLPWYIGLAWETLLFGLAMAIFGWIARVNQFAIAFVATLIVAVLARVILMSA